ncbi:MAG TPA: hypothetical protein VFN41_02645 [Candidatus Limnocylindrales bacterium]|nr:hypothetical protein [Candidatus Limnocylindrales bacterium]
MTSIDDYDRIAQTWILEGPDRIADRVLDAALTEIHGAAQQDAPIGLTRLGGKTPAFRLAAAVAIVALATGGLLIALGARDRSGGIAPSQSPTLSPSASAAFEPFVSGMYHYSIERPVTWEARPGTEDWPAQSYPLPDSAGVDRFISDDDPWTWVVVTSDALDPGEVAGERQAVLDQTNAQACQFRGRSTAVLDGVDARREEWFCFKRDHVTELFAVHGDRVYLVDLMSRSEPTDIDRAIFEHMLESFRYEE